MTADNTELIDDLMKVLEGKDISDVVPSVAYLFAVVVAEVTNGNADKNAMLAATATFVDAYAFHTSAQQAVTLN